MDRFEETRKRVRAGAMGNSFRGGHQGNYRPRCATVLGCGADGRC
jgi:hypothetical protein